MDPNELPEGSSNVDMSINMGSEKWAKVVAACISSGFIDEAKLIINQVTKKFLELEELERKLMGDEPGDSPT